MYFSDSIQSLIKTVDLSDCSELSGDYLIALVHFNASVVVYWKTTYKSWIPSYTVNYLLPHYIPE